MLIDDSGEDGDDDDVMRDTWESHQPGKVVFSPCVVESTSQIVGLS